MLLEAFGGSRCVVMETLLFLREFLMCCKRFRLMFHVSLFSESIHEVSKERIFCFLQYWQAVLFAKNVSSRSMYILAAQNQTLHPPKKRRNLSFLIVCLLPVGKIFSDLQLQFWSVPHKVIHLNTFYSLKILFNFFFCFNSSEMIFLKIVIIRKCVYTSQTYTI